MTAPSPDERERDPSVAHLRLCLGLLADRVEGEVARRRAADPAIDDPFRGLYITDAEVDGLLADGMTVPPRAHTALADRRNRIEAAADRAETGGNRLRLRALQRSFGLDAADLDLWLVAIAPDVDPRFERLYGYLHDDVSRRRASTGLALALTFGALTGPAGRERRRFGAHSALVAGGLIEIEDADRPFLTRSLRVPDRVTAHMLGDDQSDPLVAGLQGGVPSGEDEAATATVERAARAGLRLVYLREARGASGVATAASGFGSTGRAAVVLDLHILAGAPPERLVAAAVREARLRDAVLVAGPVERLTDLAALRQLADAPCPVALVGARTWDPAWSVDVPVTIDVAAPLPAAAAAAWSAELNGDGCSVDALAATAGFRLDPIQTARAGLAARRRAVAAGRSVTAADVRAGARAQNGADLERLANRVEPRAGWNDLVLPAAVRGGLAELAARVRHRRTVLGNWRMGRPGGAEGIVALFAGDSGTGKTLSAEVVAADLGLDLYVIDLSGVIDKYIGETEKNLDRIFEQADGVNGVLLFDEADALFGRRSDVRDAHDRYANVEVAYLLQRMERFDGLAILTTNLRANLDEAFTRRLAAVIDFPVPDEDGRRALWRLHLRPEVPRADDIDIEFLARSFRVSGGNIANITLTAAYLAATDRRPVAMADLIAGVEREYRKLGRICFEAEFGAWYPVVAQAQ